MGHFKVYSEGKINTFTFFVLSKLSQKSFFFRKIIKIIIKQFLASVSVKNLEEKE